MINYDPWNLTLNFKLIVDLKPLSPSSWAQKTERPPKCAEWPGWKIVDFVEDKCGQDRKTNSYIVFIFLIKFNKRYI